MNTAATLPLYSPPPDDLDAIRGIEVIEMPVGRPQSMRQPAHAVSIDH